MRFIDSNVIAYAFYDNEHRERCQNAIREGGFTDSLAIAEAFHIIERIVNRNTAKSSIKGILKSDIQIVDVDINTIFESIKRVDKCKLSMFDMVHYVSAISNNCAEILSYDKDFDSLDIPRHEP